MKRFVPLEGCPMLKAPERGGLVNDCRGPPLHEALLEAYLVQLRTVPHRDI